MTRVPLVFATTVTICLLLTVAGIQVAFGSISTSRQPAPPEAKFLGHNSSGCAGAPPSDPASSLVRWDDMLGHPFDSPLNLPGSRALPAGKEMEEPGFRPTPASVGSLAVVGGLVSPDGTVAITYYATSQDHASTILAFEREGGVALRQEKTTRVDAKRLKDEIGDRAQPIKIGMNDAIFVYGDEVLGPGERQMGVFWSDGSLDWSASTGMSRGSAADLLEIARGVYC